MMTLTATIFPDALGQPESQLKIGDQCMHPTLAPPNERGFTILEMMVAVTVMLVVTGAIFALMRDSLKITTATYEMTDAQESLRVAQEYINRDLMNSGDGLKSISTIRVPQTFVTNYLTLSPITDTSMPAGVLNLGILVSDHNVPGTTTVLGANPATTVRDKTDRQTILEIDPDPANTPIALPATPTPAIDSTGTYITVSSADITKFAVGEIYFLSSALGGTFGTIRSINAASYQLNFSNSDTYGLNLTGSSGHIKTISAGGTIPTSLVRMKIIHYYVNASGLLMRRVFGVKGAGFSESIIAEHVMNVQFNYALDMTDANGNVVQPVAMLSTPQQRLAVRQIEVTVTVETPHTLQNGSRQQISMTTTTSVRNMQFRRALQPS